MEDLLANLNFDPLASPVGLAIVAIGIRVLIGAVRTVIKLVMLAAILFGAYMFFYGGNLPFAVSG